MSHRNQANQLGVTYFRPDFILCTLPWRDDQDASDIRSDDYRSDPIRAVVSQNTPRPALIWRVTEMIVHFPDTRWHHLFAQVCWFRPGFPLYKQWVFQGFIQLKTGAQRKRMEGKLIGNYFETGGGRGVGRGRGRRRGGGGGHSRGGLTLCRERHERPA